MLNRLFETSPNRTIVLVCILVLFIISSAAAASFTGSNAGQMLSLPVGLCIAFGAVGLVFGFKNSPGHKRRSDKTDERFQALVDGAPNGIVMINKEGTIKLVNRQVEKIFGYTREELLGQQIEMLVPDSVRDRHPALRTGYFARPEPRSMGTGRDLHGVRKDKSEVPVELGLNPVRFEGEILVLASIVDITERKEAERKAEERLTAIIDAAPTGLLMINREGNITLINSQIEKTFGYTRAELVGQPIELLVPESVRPGHPQKRTGYFDNPQTKSMGSGRDLFGVRKDRGEVPVEIGLNPVRLNGEMFALASVVDITERKEAVKRIASAATRIAEGDLTQEELPEDGGDLGNIAKAFNEMMIGMRNLTKQVRDVTENVNSAATQISSSTKQQSASTKEQAATIQQISSTMKEIAETGAQIVEKAKELAAKSEQTADSSNSGLDSVRATNKTMNSIREQVEEVAENIVALSEKTQAIAEIVSTVNEVAEQSNLLALNATIEAADAGSQGSRFSVVANEMKNLADQAKQCTVQVRSILGDIQKGINGSVMLTEEAVKRVESGRKQAEVSEQAILDMADSMQASVTAFQQIIGATNQQQIGFDQVTQGMQDIDQAATQTASGTAQLEQAVSNLSSMSQQLKSAVGRYEV